MGKILLFIVTWVGSELSMLMMIAITIFTYFLTDWMLYMYLQFIMISLIFIIHSHMSWQRGEYVLFMNFILVCIPKCDSRQLIRPPLSILDCTQLFAPLPCVQYALLSVAFVCVCVCNQKKLFTNFLVKHLHEKGAYCLLIHCICCQRYVWKIYWVM